MGKRLTHLHTWQYAGNHRHPTDLVLHLIALPLVIVAALLILDGLFSLSISSLSIGIIGLIAALGIQRQLMAGVGRTAS